jgi:transposase
MSKRYELSDQEWAQIEPLLPPIRTGQKGRPAKDHRIMLNGIVWLARSGAPWRDLPERYGSWKSVYSRFCNWRDKGVLLCVFSALSADADLENLLIDSTTVKVHKSAVGVKKGPKTHKSVVPEVD